MTVIWIWATKIKNAGIVDIVWAFDFAMIAIITWVLADGAPLRKSIVGILTILWSLRLGSYLLKRVGSHLDEEEGRYRQLRAEWAPHVNLKFFVFFQMQGISNVILCTPFFISSLNPEPMLSVLEYTGACIWFLSVIGEGLADWQLQQFKKDPINKGKVCQYGLWNYSRHPNYFFQLMIWIGVCIFSLSSPYGWISIICPLSIGYLIFKVTGIPMTEEQAIRSKGESYVAYQRTTSKFVPWPKKN
jgi:steroid 5-alpha reductase family enzyme